MIPPYIQAKTLNMTGCHTCGLVVKMRQQKGRCPRCGSHLHTRKPNSLQRTWAILMAAIILYIPANTLPIMTVNYLGSGNPDTILSGVVYLLLHGMWPLALVIFIASVLVPFLKLATLVFLLVSLHRPNLKKPMEKIRLYRLIEVVGKWSMVDVFVIALLTAVVQLGEIASIQAGMGAAAFSAVVVLSMIAAMTFEPKLIWDKIEREQHSD